MQQRQLRLGDILDDYCPRERRVTNHAVVAMVGPDVKQTRCTTCDTEHEYKQARVPRQRRKAEAPAVLAQGVAGGPKRVVHDPVPDARVEGLNTSPNGLENPVEELMDAIPAALRDVEAAPRTDGESAKSDEGDDPDRDNDVEEGPVHRPLIRATLPRPEGQPPPTRPAPEFTIRQPAGRQGRFRPRHQRGASSPFHGNRSGNTSGGGGMPRHGGGRPPMPRSGKRHGPGHKRSK
jgi:hypothetical protein